MPLFGRPAPPVSRLEELKRVLIKDPTSRQFLALADEYRKAGKLREAMETLERGLTIHANYVAAHVALGRVNMELGRPDHALDNFLNALKYDRENLVALRMAGEIYLQKGEKVEAIKKLKVFRALSPGDKEVNQIVQALDIELAAARKAAGLPDIPRSTSSYVTSAARREGLTSGIRTAASISSPPPPVAPPPFPAKAAPPGVPSMLTASQSYMTPGMVSAALAGQTPPVPPVATPPATGTTGGISYPGYAGRSPGPLPPSAPMPPAAAYPVPPQAAPAGVPMAPYPPAPQAYAAPPAAAVYPVVPSAAFGMPPAAPYPAPAVPPFGMPPAPPVVPAARMPLPPSVPPAVPPSMPALTPENVTSAPAVRPQVYSPVPPAIPPRVPVQAAPAPVIPVPPAPPKPDVLEMTFDGERRTPLVVPKPPAEPIPAAPPTAPAPIPPSLAFAPQPAPEPPRVIASSPAPAVLPVVPEPSRPIQPPLAPQSAAPAEPERPKAPPRVTIPPVSEPALLPAETVAIPSLFVSPEKREPAPIATVSPAPQPVAATRIAAAEPSEASVEIFESGPPEWESAVEREASIELPPPVVERSGGFAETPFGQPVSAATPEAPLGAAEDVFGMPVSAEPGEPIAVSETLAELYRAQGYVDEAKATYEALAREEPEPEKARELIEKAAHLPVPEPFPVEAPVAETESPMAEVVAPEAEPFLEPAAAPLAVSSPEVPKKLREWAEGITIRSLGAKPEFDLGLVLERLTRPGAMVTAAFLTTTDGLPLASAGDVEGPETESFIGDLTSFWKSAESRSLELGTGGPQSLFLEGSGGLGMVAQAGMGQLLLIMARREAIRGQLRFEARRAASEIERGLS